MVIKGWNAVGIGLPRLRIARTRRKRGVVQAADVGAMRGRADVIHSQSQGTTQLPLNAEVPLLGVGILDMRVEIPLVTAERRGRREEWIASAGKWILRGHIGRKLGGGGNVGKG